MVAFAHFWPRDLIYIYGVIPVPARVLVIVTTLLTLWSGLTGAGGNVAHFAHLGGMLFGWLLLRYWSGQPPFGGNRRRPRMRVVR
jgi:membrane associated rhomboid family serine protease